MFASVKWCAEPIAQPCRLTRSRSRVWALNFVSALYLLYPWKDFLSTLVKMITSVWQCAEPITQPCGLKVKVTVEGHELEPWIWCRLPISFTPGRIFFKRWSNVCLSQMMCRTHNSAMLTQGQGQNWRPPVWALNFEAAPLSFCGGGYSCPSDCLVLFFFIYCILFFLAIKETSTIGKNIVLSDEMTIFFLFCVDRVGNLKHQVAGQGHIFVYNVLYSMSICDYLGEFWHVHCKYK